MYRLEVVCDGSKQTQTKLTALIWKPDSQLKVTGVDGRKYRAGYVWRLQTLAAVERAKAAVRGGFDRDCPPRLHDPAPWARATAYDSSGAQLFDATPAAPTLAYRVEVRLAARAELEPWLSSAVGRTPESAPGCYSWSFATLDEARHAERALRNALRENTAPRMRDRGSLPSPLANAVRTCTLHVLVMALTALPSSADA